MCKHPQSSACDKATAGSHPFGGAEFDHSVVAFVKNDDGRYTYVSQRMADELGVARDALTGTTDAEWRPIAVAARIADSDRQVVRERRTMVVTEPIATAQGKTLHWSVTKFPIHDAHGTAAVAGVAVDITGLIESQREVDERAAGLAAILDHSPELLVQFDRDLRVRFATRAARDVVDFGEDVIHGRTLAEIGVALDQHQTLDAMLHRVFNSGQRTAFEGRFMVRSEPRYFQIHLVPQCDASGTCVAVIMASRDVTRLKAAEKRLIDSERKYRRLFENNVALMCTHDFEGRVLSINAAAANALGVPADSVVGRCLHDFVAPAVRHRVAAYLLGMKPAGTGDGLLQVVAHDGSLRTLKYRSAVVTDPDSVPYVLGCAVDVTELKAAQEAARQLSLTDELTGLVNRRGFAALGEQHVRLMRRLSSDVLLLYADMDGLKAINDRYGHEEGSKAIRAVADVLKGTFRKTDIIARVGGDEFTVLVVNPQPNDEAVLPQRLDHSLRLYNAQRCHPFPLTLSVGTSRAKADANLSLERLVNEADKSMYERKQRNRQVVERS